MESPELIKLNGFRRDHRSRQTLIVEQFEEENPANLEFGPIFSIKDENL